MLALLGALPAVSADARLGYAGKIVAGALALCMLLSPALWLTRPDNASLSESFPLVPPAPGLEVLALPAPLDTGLYGAVLALCALVVVLPGRRLVLGALFGGCLLLAAGDLMRWQPWFYLYGALLGVLTFVPAASKGSRLPSWIEPLTIARLLVGCVYFYSGLNKINHSFFSENLSGFLAGLPSAVGSGPVATALTYSAPVLEMAAGAGLIVGGLVGLPRIRYGALALAASTNLFVLVTLILSGGNPVVWPWNLAMVALLIVLFAARDKERQEVPRSRTRAHTGGQARALPGYVYALLVVTLFAVMPAAGILGHWPSYLSFALYSENTAAASVATEDGRIEVTEMAYEHLNVPAYPAPAVYEAAGERACASGRDTAPVLVVHERPDILDGARERREYGCSSG